MNAATVHNFHYPETNSQRRTARTMNDENRVQHTRITRSKLATSTEITTTTTTALQSKVGNNATGTRKRAALGDVTNAHKKPALADVTNAVLKKETLVDKPIVKRPISRKPSTVGVKKTTETQTKAVAPVKSTASVVIPKKRPSEAVAPAPRRTLTQSTSATTLASKTDVRVLPRGARRHAEEPAEAEAPRKKQKVEKKPEWEDLDAADINDPQMVSEYVNDIFDYMRDLEVYHSSNLLIRAQNIA